MNSGPEFEPQFYGENCKKVNDVVSANFVVADKDFEKMVLFCPNSINNEFSPSRVFRNVTKGDLIVLGGVNACSPIQWRIVCTRG